MSVLTREELMVKIQNLQSENWQLKEANKALQAQADRIATLRMHGRFGCDPFGRDPFGCGRPLV